jgi:hypothetical protein
MKRIGRIGISVLSMALLAPAAVSAHSPAAPPYGAHVDKAVCSNRGGEHGFGKVQLQMNSWARNDPPNWPTVNYMRIVGRMDQKIDGVWVKGSATTATSPSNPDGTGFIYPALLGLGWHFPSADHPRTRLVMRVEFWDDRPNRDVRIARISARTEAC